MARPIQRLVYPPELARHVKADVRPRPLERGLLRQGNQCLSFRDASGGAQEYQNNSCSDDGKRRHSSRCPRPVLGLSMGMAETCASTLLRAGYCPRWKDDIPGYLQAEAPWNHRRIRGTVPYKNSHEYSWESHEILMRKWKLSTILMRISWAFHQISWESHEIFVFTWKLERFLMRFSSFHELLMRFLMSFSWDSRESFFHVKIGTLSHENLMRMSRDSHEHFWAFSHENSEYGDWCLHWILMRFSWDSHEAEIFSRDSHESAVVSWGSHKILMRFSRDFHEIITRFLWDSHEIQVYRYNEHKPNPSFLFFNFFCTTCYVLWSDPGCKKVNNIFCIYIYKNLLKSDSHSLIQTLPLLVAHNTSLVKTQVASFASDS